MVEKIYHINDRTMKYISLAQSKRQHQYLGLPGELKIRMPQEITFPNLEVARADEIYVNDEGLIINLEEESRYITPNTLEKFGKYVIFFSYRYLNKVYLAVLCHKDPKKEFEYYEYSPSLYIKIHYFYFPQEELWEKYENIICKVKHKKKLTGREALDMAFVPKFISKKYAPEVTEKLIRIFNDAKIEDELLKLDVGAILTGMVLKYFKSNEKQSRLLGMINMRHFESEIQKLVYDEYGEELDKKDETIEKQSKELENQSKQIKSQTKELENQSKQIKSQTKELENQSEQINQLNKNEQEYKKKLKQLNELDDLNSPEGKKIISTLIMMWY